jgi:stalled ribosome alternative rescue factor ArfA
MERKGCKTFATTTEAEIEEKRLKWNAERTIKQNKAAAAILKDYLFQKKMETGKNIAYNYTVTCIMCAVWYIMQDIWIRL